MYKRSGFVRWVLLIAALPVGGAALAAATLATEFPEASQIQPPADMPGPAKAIWERQRASSAKFSARTLGSSPVADIASLPIVERSFKPMRERVEQLAKARGTLPEDLNATWVVSADVSKSPLARCTLDQTTPSGVEADGKLTGQIRVFNCPKIGPVSLTEELLSKGGMVSLASTDDVNARIRVGGIERGVIASRLIRPEDKEEMTMVRWRSGDKSVTLHVAGTQANSLEFVKQTVDSIAD